MVRFLHKNIDIVCFVHLKNKEPLSSIEYSSSGCQNTCTHIATLDIIKFQQVLPQAFAKTLKTEETVTRLYLCLISSNACSKKVKIAFD